MSLVHDLLNLFDFEVKKGSLIKRNRKQYLQENQMIYIFGEKESSVVNVCVCVFVCPAAVTQKKLIKF